MAVIYCFGDNHNFTFNNGHSLICVRLNIRLKTDQYLSKWFKVPAFGAFVNSHSLSSTEWRRIDKSFIFFKMFSPIPLKLGLYEEKMMFLLFFHWNLYNMSLSLKNTILIIWFWLLPVSVITWIYKRKYRIKICKYKYSKF